MTELDQVWSEMLGDAFESAAAAGNHALADYLRLKTTNNAIRMAGVKWLFNAFVELAGEAVRHNGGLTIEREEPHNFARGNSNMVGSRLLIHQGVRCLTIEAGWTRTPRDGVMQGGALAFARVHHFGIPRAAEELRLVHVETFPQWLSDRGSLIASEQIRQHFDLFLTG
jgi:hypothetical protein